jgi:hypothetical protein
MRQRAVDVIIRAGNGDPGASGHPHCRPRELPDLHSILLNYLTSNCSINGWSALEAQLCENVPRL